MMSRPAVNLASVDRYAEREITGHGKVNLNAHTHARQVLENTYVYTFIYLRRKHVDAVTSSGVRMYSNM